MLAIWVYILHPCDQKRASPLNSERLNIFACLLFLTLKPKILCKGDKWSENKEQQSQTTIRNTVLKRRDMVLYCNILSLTLFTLYRRHWSPGKVQKVNWWEMIRNLGSLFLTKILKEAPCPNIPKRLWHVKITVFLVFIIVHRYRQENDSVMQGL